MLPLLTNSTANALPMPEFPPVITTTCPSKRTSQWQTPPAKYLLKNWDVF